MQSFINYLKESSDQSLSQYVEQIFQNDASDGKALANNELVTQLIHNEAIPLAAFEKATLLEFVWRGLTIDQAKLREKLHGDYGVDLNSKEIVNPLSTREMN